MGTKFSTRVWVSVVGIASIFFGSKGYADTVISVADFGLKPDTRENAVAYVQKAIEACRGKEPVTLVFPEGRYDFWPQYAHEKNYYETNTYDVFPIPLPRAARWTMIPLSAHRRPSRSLVRSSSWIRWHPALRRQTRKSS